jgi:hypothetical protein
MKFDSNHFSTIICELNHFWELKIDLIHFLKTWPNTLQMCSIKISPQSNSALLWMIIIIRYNMNNKIHGIIVYHLKVRSKLNNFDPGQFWVSWRKQIRVITKLPISEQSYKGEVKTHNELFSWKLTPLNFIIHIIPYDNNHSQ